MGNLLKVIFVLGLAFALPVFGATPENCAAAKRGDHLTGKYASLQRCIKNGNCPTHRRTPTKKKKMKKPQGEASGSH